ncbi:hypothetical protein AB1E18_000764 [Capra hircus]
MCLPHFSPGINDKKFFSLSEGHVLVNHLCLSLTALGLRCCVLAFSNSHSGTSLGVHWLRLQAPNAEGLGSIPGQGTRIHLSQLRPSLGGADPQGSPKAPKLASGDLSKHQTSGPPGGAHPGQHPRAVRSYLHCKKYVLYPNLLSRVPAAVMGNQLAGIAPSQILSVESYFSDIHDFEYD